MRRDVSGTKQTVYYVSGKIKKNIKNLYVFYTPFDDYISTNKKGTTTTDGTMEVYVNDKINVTYKYPAELTNVRYSDLNVYLLAGKDNAGKECRWFSSISTEIQNVG